MKYFVMRHHAEDPRVTQVLSHHKTLDEAVQAVDMWTSVGYQNLTISRRSHTTTDLANVARTLAAQQAKPA